ncbi:Rrp15p-domain-containing protein [Xylariaceae sp. FL0016]|nr:Rrp15p-domain-containing protein [Xylariaceae sp. FL0016]
MGGPNLKRRNNPDYNSKVRPKKKQRREKQLARYNSDSDQDSNPDFQPVNLLEDSDIDIDDAAVDDIGSLSGSDNLSSESEPELRSKLSSRKKISKKPVKSKKNASDNEDNEEEEEKDDDDDNEQDEDEATGSEAEDSEGGTRPNTKSKRNDPAAFSTSISKILSTKLSNNKRADPVLSRSADAQKASREAVDSALEAKARRHLREQKKLAQEKGRVKDVLAGGFNAKTGEPETSTGEIIQTEKRLRKTAHRGVVTLFRAFREAQERAAEAERDARKEGVFGVGRREEKVNEMSRQGFLDLIAGGGGKMKKGGLEEA